MAAEQNVKSKTEWYRVTSTTPISVDYQNGRAVSVHYGCVFEADPNLRDVRRMLRLLPRPIVCLGSVAPPASAKVRLMPAPGPAAHMPADSSPKPTINLPAGVHELVRTWER